MEMKQVKTPSLYLLFLRYLAIFCVSNIIVLVALVVFYLYAMGSGVILPANYSQLVLSQGEEILKNKVPFDPDMIPFTCEYVLFSREGKVLGTSMEEEGIQRAARFLSGDSQGDFGHYFQVERQEGSLVIRYDILCHFASPELHRIFPKPELLLLLVFLAVFLILTFVTAMRFGRMLKAQLSPLIAATEAIKRQELTFEVTPANVREFNTVLESIEDMRAALKASLEQQWEVEHSRQTQVAALAHDIKTPLTLVKGNAELLLEAKLEEEPMDLAETVYRSAVKIEQYVGLLMDAATAENPSAISAVYFPLSGLLEEIASSAKGLCMAKNLTFSMETKQLPESFYGDRTLIFRALLNLLDNASEYSPADSGISLFAEEKDGLLSFTVTDSGKGFSGAGLKQAARQFYTEEKERSGKHYGMGLFLVKTVAQKHDGQLILSNRKDSSGAVVTLTLRDRSRRVQEV